MIGINVTKLNASLDRLKQVRKKVEGDADAIWRKKIYWVAELAAYVSPQFSGDFVSNWHIVVDGNMPVYHEGGAGAEVTSFTSSSGQVKYGIAPYQAGDLANIRNLLSRFGGQLQRVTRKSNVHLVNASPLDTDGTHMSGPDGVVKLRAVNIIPGSVRIEQYLRARAGEYKPQNIPLDISP